MEPEGAAADSSVRMASKASIGVAAVGAAKGAAKPRAAPAAWAAAALQSSVLMVRPVIQERVGHSGSVGRARKRSSTTVITEAEAAVAAEATTAAVEAAEPVSATTAAGEAAAVRRTRNRALRTCSFGPTGRTHRVRASSSSVGERRSALHRENGVYGIAERVRPVHF